MLPFLDFIEADEQASPELMLVEVRQSHQDKHMVPTGQGHCELRLKSTLLERKIEQTTIMKTKAIPIERAAV